MKTSIVRIGNSQGIRLPKPLLEKSGLSGEVEIEARANQLLIRPAHGPRRGWEEAFAAMRAVGDDALLDHAHAHSAWDEGEWQWK